MVDQPDLFDRDHDVEPRVHREAHDTERDWAAASKKRWIEGGLAARVFDLVNDRRGLTGWEAAKLTDNLAVEWSVRPILSRMKKEGFAVVTKWRRRNARGAREVVYVSTHAYLARLHEDPELVMEREDAWPSGS